MADLSDVRNALVSVLAAAFYPNGTTAPSAIDATVELRPGWPTPNRINDALAGKRVLVTVYPPPNLERDRTRALNQWITARPPRHTVTASVSGDTVTIGGTAEAGQNVGLIVGQASFVHPVQPTDTPTTIAAALAGLIVASDRTASSLGPVLTVPGTARLIARVGGTGRLVKEVERTDRSFMISIWAPDDALRTAAGRVIRSRLSDPRFIGLADGSAGWVRYERTNDNDNMERADLYRRDLSYWVEFGQYLVEDGFEVILPQTAAQPARNDGSLAAPPITTTA